MDEGRFVWPGGLFDAQVNGSCCQVADGSLRCVDFSGPDLSPADCRAVARALAARGTWAFLPTLITGPIYLMERNLEVLARFATRHPEGARCPGVHLEGPFFNPESGATGAHPVQHCLAKADVALFERLFEASGRRIRLLTVGADVKGVTKLIERARSLGCAVWLGHHTATVRQIEEAVAAGAGGCTHLGNGCPNQVHRHGAHIVSQLAEPGLTACIIADGLHLPSAFIRVVFAVKGVERTVLVSDASSVAGAKTGSYRLGETEVSVVSEGGCFKVVVASNPQALAGSWVQLLDCVNHVLGLVRTWGFSVSPAVSCITQEQVIQMAWLNPLREVNLDPDWFASLGGTRLEIKGDSLVPAAVS